MSSALDNARRSLAYREGKAVGGGAEVFDTSVRPSFFRLPCQGPSYSPVPVEVGKAGSVLILVDALLRGAGD
jgi:hypothetical protein